MWLRIADFILKYRLPLLIAVASISIGLFIYAVPRITFSQEFISVVPEDDEDYQAYQQFRKTFGEDGGSIIAVLEGDGARKYEALNDLQDYVDYFKSQEGIANAFAPTTVPMMSVDGNAGRFEVRPATNKPLKNQKQADRLIRKLKKEPFYQGLLFGNEKEDIVVVVTLTKEVLATLEKHPLIAEVLQKMEALGEKHGFEPHFAGVPYVRTFMFTRLPLELSIFMGVALLFTGITLFLFYRQWAAVVVPVVLLMMSAISTLGYLAITGGVLQILNALLPPLIIILGVPPCIYMLSEYQQEFRVTGDKREALRQMVRKLGLVTFMIMGNTALSFFFLAFTEINLLQQMGLVAFASIMTTYVFTLVVITAVFSYLPAPSTKKLKHLDSKYLNRFLDSLYFLVMKRRKYVWIGTAVVVVAMAIGAALYLRPEFYILDDIPQSDKIYKDLQYVEDKFDGAMPFEIVIDTKRKGGATKLRNLRQVNKLQRKIEQYPEISRTVSLVDVLKWGRQALMMGDRSAYQLPIREEYDFIQVYAAESKDYTTKAKGAKQNAAEGGMMGAQLTDSTKQKLRITGFVRDIGASKMPELISRVEADMDSIFSKVKNPKHRMTGEVTGTSKIFLKTNKYLLDNLRITLIATLIIVCFQMFYLFKSWRIMLIAVAANLVPLLFTAGFMGFTGIPLKPSTMLIFQLSFSIAVDDCIHYLSMYRHERKTGASVQNAAGRTIRHTGLSIIYTSVVLFMGFMVFVPSAFGTTKYLGLLTAVTLMIAMFINLILVPALLMSFDTKKFDKDDGGLTAE